MRSRFASATAVSTAEAYEHAPAMHVPSASKVWRVVADAHTGAGGVSHARGVPLHTPLVQTSPVVHASPSSHPTPSAKAYEHTPSVQVPIG